MSEAAPDGKLLPAYNGPNAPNVRGAATGFFHLEQLDGRWWFVDPVGNGFFAVGIDGPGYNGRVMDGITPGVDGEGWAADFTQQLTKAGFNTLSNLSSPALRHRGMPHAETLHIGRNAALTESFAGHPNTAGFPNVYDPEWPEHCDRWAKAYAAPNRDDPWLLGYYLDNELQWYPKSLRPGALFEEAWRKPADHSVKRAWVDFLKRRLKGPEEFEAVWGIKVDYSPGFSASAGDDVSSS